MRFNQDESVTLGSEAGRARVQAWELDWSVLRAKYPPRCGMRIGFDLHACGEIATLRQAAIKILVCARCRTDYLSHMPDVKFEKGDV